jgi:hypothetical protein
MRLLPGFLAAALLAGACSTTPAITVVATPVTIAGDGLSVITVTAKPTEGGSGVDAVVHFTLLVAGVPNQPTYAAWDGATGDPTKIDVTASQGSAVATLKAPRQGFGTVTFTVSFSSQGQEPTATTTVTLTPSGGFATSLSFICQHQNVGGLVHGRLTDVHVLCRATAVDASNHPIPNASVQTLAEAGTLTWHDDSAGVQEFIYSIRPDDAPPKDVNPFDSTGKEQDICPSGCTSAPFGSSCQGEPCWTDPTGLTHNPRDGIATLIAAVPAVKGFDNLGEPFVDMNDNGVRDPGEPYIDYNGNGKYDPPSGANQDHMVWKTYRIIWSGEGAVTATGATGTPHDVFMTLTKADATHASAELRLFDRNFNQVAADGPSNSDGIAWSATCSNGGTIAFGVSDQIMEQHDPGVLFAADTGSISVPGQRSTWTRQTDYVNSIIYTPGTAPDTCAIDAKPHRLYDPGAIDIVGDGSDPDAALVGSITFP